MTKHVVKRWVWTVVSLFFFDSKHFFGTKAAKSSRLLLFQGRACSVHWNSVLTEVRFSSQSPTTRTNLLSPFFTQPKNAWITIRFHHKTHFFKNIDMKKVIETHKDLPKLKFSYLTFPHDFSGLFVVGVSSYISATVLFGDCNIQSPATLGSKDYNGKVKLP